MKIALITGGSRGIGAETVKKFAKENYTVILNYNRSESEAQTLKKELVSVGCDVHLYKADVSNATEVCQMFSWVAKYFKHLDVLVNNAGVSRSGMICDVAEFDYDLVMNVNAKGTFLCCQQALPLLAKNGGAIVNVSSIWGLYGASCESVYAMSKFAVVGLTKSLAEELSSSNVTVNCICPPIVLTDMCKGYTDEDIADFCAQRGKKAFTPEQIAEGIFALSQSGENGKILEL